jgi:LacI family transcriptional regulator
MKCGGQLADRQARTTIHEMKRTTLTIQDIARRAKVSIGTVSRVLNDAPNIDPEIRERTRQIIASTGYRPKEAARRLRRRSGWSGAIRLVTPQSDATWQGNPLFAALISGVSEVCRAERVDLRLGMTEGVRADGPCDGILVKSWQLDATTVEQLRAVSSALVACFSPAVPGVMVVNADNRSATRLAIEHLRARGHRRIAFIAENLEHPAFAERAATYVQLMMATQEFRPEWMAISGTPLGTSAQSEFPQLDDLLARLLATPLRPTAVIAANDWFAAGLYGACQRKGLRIPEDLSIMGFDNVGPLALTLQPALTTLTVPFAEVAGTAARLLIATLRGEEEAPVERLLPCALVERASVGMCDPTK